ncbi:GGDEF domain-containing protein [Variovorax sp. PAMC 28711]|uniref:GGDEF domain-containing protein n=1 Tax=Variovorax sp. PAMC 28711 TaxID=1795631 RepID=UPI001AEF9DEA|nr:diguanylate cyclase [Variovorax sp. PAMC 28711]
MTEVPGDEALVQFLYRAPIGLIQTTSDGTIILINPMAAQLLMPLAPGGTMVNLFEVLKAVAPGLRDLASARSLPGDLVCEALPLLLPHLGSGHGATQVLGLHMTRMDDSTLMACLSDLTVAAQREHQRLEATLHGQKRIDALTSLPNRMAVLERIQRLLARRQDEPGLQFGVLLVNADRFERINVTLGHAAGDEVLRLMGSRVASAAWTMGRAAAPGNPPPWQHGSAPTNSCCVSMRWKVMRLTRPSSRTGCSAP